MQSKVLATSSTRTEAKRRASLDCLELAKLELCEMAVCVELETERCTKLVVRQLWLKS